MVLIWAQLPRHADPGMLAELPVLPPPVAVVAGTGWLGWRLPGRVTYVAGLGTAVGVISRAVG